MLREDSMATGVTLPLSGIRVVDLSRVFAMPYVGAYLADLGAEVIKIDTHYAQFVDTTRTLTGPYPDNDPGEDFWNRAGTFQTLNRGKRSLTLDLRKEEGRKTLLDLLRVSDVALENFTPRVTRRFGLDYPNLKSVKPDLILVSNTGYGHSGPWSDFGAMASALEPTHGAGAFMGYSYRDEAGRTIPGSIPNKIGNSYTDFLACWSAQLAIMAALLRRARTGQGILIDLAMYQVGVSFFGEGLLDYAFNGRRTRRPGNRHEFWSPHGCYACQGRDKWVTLAVRDDAEWRSFCRVLEQPALTYDHRFADPVARRQSQDELDEIITRWTGERTQNQVVNALQAVGVPAGPALDAGQLLADPHLRARGFFETVEHPPDSDADSRSGPDGDRKSLPKSKSNLGRREYLGRGWRLSGADVHLTGPAPLLGEDNEYVLGQLLGRSAPDLDRLRADGVIGERLEGAGTAAVVPLARQEELGWIAGYSTDYAPVKDDAKGDRA